MIRSNKAQVMILTGCASGIGRHLAGVLAAQGHNLIVTDINEKALQSHAAAMGWEQERVLVRRLDVRAVEEWRRIVDLAVEKWERLDVLMNIAGYLRPGFIHETEPEQVALHLDINAKGVIFGTQVAAVQMVKQHKGHIINIASLAGVTPTPGLGLYTASKFAVRGFSLAAAMELRPHGVYVTVICPDAVQTPMLDDELNYKEAALVFSGGKFLTVKDIERVLLDRVLPRKPLEVVIPSARALSSKMAGAVPNLLLYGTSLVMRKGLAQQAALKRQRSDAGKSES